MRKKSHRRINANNHEYDRFYVINYLVKTLIGRKPLALAEYLEFTVCVTSGVGQDLGGGAERGRWRAGGRWPR